LTSEGVGLLQRNAFTNSMPVGNSANDEEHISIIKEENSEGMNSEGIPSSNKK